jgi:hypothetical protein
MKEKMRELFRIFFTRKLWDWIVSALLGGIVSGVLVYWLIQIWPTKIVDLQVTGSGLNIVRTNGIQTYVDVGAEIVGYEILKFNNKPIYCVISTQFYQDKKSGAVHIYDSKGNLKSTYEMTHDSPWKGNSSWAVGSLKIMDVLYDNRSEEIIINFSPVHENIHSFPMVLVILSFQDDTLILRDRFWHKGHFDIVDKLDIINETGVKSAELLCKGYSNEWERFGDLSHMYKSYEIYPPTDKGYVYEKRHCPASLFLLRIRRDPIELSSFVDTSYSSSIKWYYLSPNYEKFTEDSFYPLPCHPKITPKRMILVDVSDPKVDKSGWCIINPVTGNIENVGGKHPPKLFSVKF